ncbi:phospholipase-like protein [Tanacetum coccineum]
MMSPSWTSSVLLSFREYGNGDIPFRNRLFPEKIGYDVKIIDALALIEDEEKFSKVNDEDAIRVCLLLSMEVIFIGPELVSVVDDVFLRMVDNLDTWNSFPWGEHIWRQLYDSIRNVSSKHKLEHLDGLRKNPNHVPSYSLSGFLFAFKVISLKNGIEKEEGLKKFGPQIEDILESTSEDESDIKDDTSLKEDIGDVYCCDVNGDNSKKEYQIIRLSDQRQQDAISKMAKEDKKKIEFEIQRLYNHMEARLNKIVEEDKQRKCIGHMNSSAHMKLAIGHCVSKKRKYVDVMRSLYIGLSTTLNVPSMEKLANQKNVLNQLMIEKRKSVKPWIEDLKRPFKRIDRIFLSHDLEEWLSRFVVGRFKFPWCNDIAVDRSFWHGLCGLDDNYKGWLLDEHIDLWVMYLWHTRQFDMDWAMVSCYFLPLLLQGSMPLFYANNDRYLVAWSNVERVFIPINEPMRHCSLAMFHICSRIITFYDSEKTLETHDEEFRPWYLKMGECLEEKIHVVLKETGVLKRKILTRSSSHIFEGNLEEATAIRKAISLLRQAIESSPRENTGTAKPESTRVMLLVLGETMQVDRQGLLNATTVKVKDIWLGNALSLSDQGMQHGIRIKQC